MMRGTQATRHRRLLAKTASRGMHFFHCSRVTFRAHVTRVPVRGFSSIAHSALASILGNAISGKTGEVLVVGLAGKPFISRGFILSEAFRPVGDLLELVG